MQFLRELRILSSNMITCNSSFFRNLPKIYLTKNVTTNVYLFLNMSGLENLKENNYKEFDRKCC